MPPKLGSGSLAAMAGATQITPIVLPGGTRTDDTAPDEPVQRDDARERSRMMHPANAHPSPLS
jgi:hypothetical protein